MATNDIVQTFKQGKVDITIYETDSDFVAADQGGWLPGSWPTIDEAMQAAKAANGLAEESDEEFTDRVIAESQRPDVAPRDEIKQAVAAEMRSFLALLSANRQSYTGQTIDQWIAGTADEYLAQEMTRDTEGADRTMR